MKVKGGGVRSRTATRGHRRGWTVAAVATSAVLSACGRQACTAVGCFSGISITTPSIVAGHSVSELTICGLGPCRTEPAAAGPSGVLASVAVPSSSLPSSHRVTVVVHLLDASGADLLTARNEIPLARRTPNGPECGPVCFFSAVSVSNDGRLSIGST